MPEYKNPGKIQFKAKLIEGDGGGAHQREYHLWIENAKRAETRSKRIEQMIEKLEANQKLK